MKGQFRILNEVLLFAIGIAMVSFIVLSFRNVEDSTSRIVVEDNLKTISNIVLTGMMKVYKTNSIIRMEIPEHLSKYSYIISLNPDDKTIIIKTVEDLDIKFVQQVFNIGDEYTISGDVLSTGRFIYIEKYGTTIKIQRRLRT